MSLTHSARSGLLWSAVDRFLQQGLTFAITILLARIIAPAEYGLIAVVAVFLAISEAIVSAGLSEALIQKKNLDKSDSESVFYFNLVASAFLVGGLQIGAPHIANFFHEERLIAIIRVLSIGIFFQALSIIQVALMTKAVNFKQQTKATLPGQVIAGMLGLSWAYAGFGVWALVGASLSGKLLSSLFLWKWGGWRPAAPFSLSALKALMPYGFRMGLSQLLDVVFVNIYALVIGRIYEPAQLAYYQRAKGFQQLPVTNLQAIVGRVLFPLMATVQDDDERMRRVTRRVIKLLVFIIFPTMAIIALVSDDLVIFLIGEKWMPSVPLLRLLCVCGALYPIHALNLMVLRAKGLAKLFLRLEIIKKSMVVAILMLTFKYGVYAMVVGQVAGSFIALGINSFYTKKHLDYGLLAQIYDFLPYLCITASSSLGVYYCMGFFALPLFISLACSSILFAVLYFGFAFIFRLSALSEIPVLIQRR